MPLAVTSAEAARSEAAKLEARTIMTDGATVSGSPVVGALPNGSGGNMSEATFDQSPAFGNMVEAQALSTLRQVPAIADERVNALVPAYLLQPYLAIGRGCHISSLGPGDNPISFPTVDYDPTGRISGNGGPSWRYTVPVSGRYEIYGALLPFGGNPANHVTMDWKLEHLNAAETSTVGLHRLDTFSVLGFAHYHLKGLAIVSAAAGEKFRFIVYSSVTHSVSQLVNESYAIIRRVA